jgi:hypothetical protein
MKIDEKIDKYLNEDIINEELGSLDKMVLKGIGKVLVYVGKYMNKGDELNRKDIMGVYDKGLKSFKLKDPEKEKEARKILKDIIDKSF